MAPVALHRLPLETIAEYHWARDAAGLALATLDGLAKPVLEVRQH